MTESLRAMDFASPSLEVTSVRPASAFARKSLFKAVLVDLSVLHDEQQILPWIREKFQLD